MADSSVVGQVPVGSVATALSKLPSLRSLFAVVLAIAIPLTAYFVFYVGNQQQYLMDRNQRALDSVATEMRERIRLLATVLEFNEVEGSDDDQPAWSVAIKNNPWLRNSVLTKDESQPSIDRCEKRKGLAVYNLEGGKLVAEICSGVKKLTRWTSFSVPLTDLVPAPPRAAVIDGVLLVDDAGPQLVYASKGAQWVSDAGVKKMLATVQEEHKQFQLLPGVRQLELYHSEVVVQHVALTVQGLDQKLTLLAFVDAGRFQREVLKVSPSYWLGTLALLMLLMCSVPFLKVWLVSEEDALSRVDLWAMGMGLVIGTGVVLVAALDVLEFRAVTQKLETNGEEIAEDIQAAMASELVSWVDQIRTELELAWPTSSNLRCKESGGGKCKRRAITVPDYAAGSTQDAPLIDMIFALGPDGNMVGGEVSERRQPLIMGTSLKDRGYFKRTVDNRSTCVPIDDAVDEEGVFDGWQIAKGCNAGQVPLTLDRVRTRDQGVSLAILAMPLVSNEKTSADSKFLVLVAAGQFVSLHQAVLPRPFSYAVIENQTGKVLYHKDDTRSLVENFYEEIQQHTLLKGAAQSRHAWQGNVSYHGVNRYAHLRPLPYADWSLVVLRNDEAASALNFEIVVVAFLQYLTFMTLLALATLPVSRLLMPAKAAGRRFQNLRWPNSLGDPVRAISLYQGVTTVVVLIIVWEVILIISLGQYQAPVLAALLLFGLLGMSISTFIVGSVWRQVRLDHDEFGMEPWDSRGRRNRFGRYLARQFWFKPGADISGQANRVRWLLIGVIGFLAAVVSGWIVNSTPLPEIGQYATGLVLWVAAMIALAPRPPFLANGLAVQKRFRRAYIGLVTSLLILLAVIPCTVIFYQTTGLALRAFIHFAANDLVHTAYDRSQNMHTDWHQRVKGQSTSHGCIDFSRLQKAAMAGVYPKELVADNAPDACFSVPQSQSERVNRLADARPALCDMVTGQSPVGWLFCRLPAMSDDTARIRLEMDEADNSSTGKDAGIASVSRYLMRLNPLTVSDYLVPNVDDLGGRWFWQLVQWLLFAVLIASLVMLLKRFLQATAQNVFAMDVADLEPERQFASGHELIDNPVKAFRRDYLLVRPDQQVVDKLKAYGAEGPRPVEVIDCAHLGATIVQPEQVEKKNKLSAHFDRAMAGVSNWAEGLTGRKTQSLKSVDKDTEQGEIPPVSGGTLILNFAYKLNDQALWKQKLDLLENLLRVRATHPQEEDGHAIGSIVIVSELDVLPRLTDGFGQIESILGELESQRSVFLLRGFRKARFSWFLPDEDQVRAREKLAQFKAALIDAQISGAEYRQLVDTAKELWHECKLDPATREIWFEFVMRTEAPVLELPARGRDLPTAGQWLRKTNPMIGNSLESLIGLIRDRADGYYSAVWSMCVPEERRQLYYLARGNICNPRNRQVLMHLMHRRQVINRPNLRLTSAVFRRFILDVVQEEEVEAWRLGRQSNQWSRWRAPLAAFLLVMVAIVIWTQGESVESLGRVFVAFAAVLPLLGLGGRGAGGGSD